MILQANNIQKIFIGDTKVLDDVSFEINKGDFVSILGASGSGKSTLLTILAGLDKPTSGEVFFDGINISKSSEKELAILRRTRIGYVFQFFNLVPYMSVKENVLLPLILSGEKVKNFEDKLMSLLEKMGLTEYQDRLPSKLSGGEQQRVAIARSMMFEPDILFLDEPTGNLDSKTGMEIMKTLQKINQENNVTIIQVTHSRENAKLSNRLIFIKDGNIVETPDVELI